MPHAADSANLIGYLSPIRLKMRQITSPSRSRNVSDNEEMYFVDFRRSNG